MTRNIAKISCFSKKNLKGNIMMAIQFIIDSASDILPEEANELGVICLPLTVRFDDEEFEVVLVSSSYPPVIAFTFIYTGLLYLVNSVMFKGDKSFKKVFTMYGVNSVITSATLLATAIFMFIRSFYDKNM